MKNNKNNTFNMEDFHIHEPTIEEQAMCTICKGNCCKKYGCGIAVYDITRKGIPLTFEALRDEIIKGYISIDKWEVSESDIAKGIEDNLYFLRMRHKDSPVVDFPYYGECVALTETGCTFSYEDRPYGGKVLIPNVQTGNCTSIYTKENQYKDWYEYRDLLQKLVNYFS